MVSGIGGWEGFERYFGPLGKSFTASLSAVTIFRSLFPGVSYTPDDSRFSWAASQGLLSKRQIRILSDIDRQVHGEPIEMPDRPEPEPEVEPEPEPEPEPEQKPETPEQGPKPLPYQDHSLWDLAGKALSSWLRGLCVNGINLDPKAVRTVADAATVAGGFGAMLFLLYLVKREPKTDYYHCTRVAVPHPLETSRKSRPNRLLELEAALLKLKSVSLKEPT